MYKVVHFPWIYPKHYAYKGMLKQLSNEIYVYYVLHTQKTTQVSKTLILGNIIVIRNSKALSDLETKPVDLQIFIKA